jgi:VanZ family protein
MNSTSSSHTIIRKCWRITGWGLVVAIIVLSLIPAPLLVPGEQGDKIEHLIAYSGLMLWFVQDHARTQWYKLALGFCVMGITLEFLQKLTGYRTFDYLDMAANTTGVLLAWFLAINTVLSSILTRIEHKFYP